MLTKPASSTQFCPACARRQFSLWGGYKRACSSALVEAHEGSSAFVRPLLALGSSGNAAAGGEVAEKALVDGKAECPAAGLLSNFSVSWTEGRIGEDDC